MKREKKVNIWKKWRLPSPVTGTVSTFGDGDGDGGSSDVPANPPTPVPAPVPQKPEKPILEQMFDFRALRYFRRITGHI